MTGRVILLLAVVASALLVAVLMLWSWVAMGPLINQPPSESIGSFRISVPADDSNQAVRFGPNDVEGMKLRQAEWPLRQVDPYDSVIVDTGILFLDDGETRFEYCFEDPVSLLRDEEDDLDLFEPGDCVNSEDRFYHPLGRLPE
ncbi:MAG: hypothetical protein ACLFRV_12710 [Acidimicrobiales bacterium]